MSGAECPLSRNSDEDHDLVAPSKVLDALCRAAKAQSCWKARSSRAASGIRSLRRGLKDLNFEKSINRDLRRYLYE